MKQPRRAQTHQRLQEFSFATRNRLLQQHLPKPEAASAWRYLPVTLETFFEDKADHHSST
jgi:hypothetical protein